MEGAWKIDKTVAKKCSHRKYDSGGQERGRRGPSLDASGWYFGHWPWWAGSPTMHDPWGARWRAGKPPRPCIHREPHASRPPLAPPRLTPSPPSPFTSLVTPPNQKYPVPQGVPQGVASGRDYCSEAKVYPLTYWIKKLLGHLTIMLRVIIFIPAAPLLRWYYDFPSAERNKILIDTKGPCSFYEIF
jgi:hypothetical protein